MWIGMVCEARTLHPHTTSIQSSDFWFYCVVCFLIFFFCSVPIRLAFQFFFVCCHPLDNIFLTVHLHWTPFLELRWGRKLDLSCHSFQRHSKWNAKIHDTANSTFLSKGWEHFFFSRIWKLDCNRFYEIRFFFIQLSVFQRVSKLLLGNYNIFNYCHSKSSRTKN